MAGQYDIQGSIRDAVRKARRRESLRKPLGMRHAGEFDTNPLDPAAPRSPDQEFAGVPSSPPTPAAQPQQKRSLKRKNSFSDGDVAANPVSVVSGRTPEEHAAIQQRVGQITDQINTLRGLRTQRPENQVHFVANSQARERNARLARKSEVDGLRRSLRGVSPGRAAQIMSDTAQQQQKNALTRRGQDLDYRAALAKAEGTKGITAADRIALARLNETQRHNQVVEQRQTANDQAQSVDRRLGSNDAIIKRHLDSFESDDDKQEFQRWVSPYAAGADPQELETAASSFKLGRRLESAFQNNDYVPNWFNLGANFNPATIDRLRTAVDTLAAGDEFTTPDGYSFTLDELDQGTKDLVLQDYYTRNRNTGMRR